MATEMSQCALEKDDLCSRAAISRFLLLKTGCNRAETRPGREVTRAAQEHSSRPGYPAGVQTESLAPSLRGFTVIRTSQWVAAASQEATRLAATSGERLVRDDGVWTGDQAEALGQGLLRLVSVSGLVLVP